MIIQYKTINVGYANTKSGERPMICKVLHTACSLTLSENAVPAVACEQKFAL